jgi:hypothetical protein
MSRDTRLFRSEDQQNIRPLSDDATAVIAAVAGNPIGTPLIIVNHSHHPIGRNYK